MPQNFFFFLFAAFFVFIGVVSQSSIITKSCNPEMEFKKIYGGSINCSNLLFLHEINHVKYYLEQFNDTFVKQWLITTNIAKDHSFSFKYQSIDKIIDYRFFNANAENVFQNVEGYFLAYWNLIIPDPDPIVLFLTNAPIVAFMFEGSNILIFGGRGSSLTKNFHRTDQNSIKLTETSIAEFEKNIIGITFHEILPTTLIITFEDESQEFIDYKNPPPFKALNKVSGDIFTANHVTMLIISGLMLCSIFAAVYAFKKYLKTKYHALPHVPAPNNSGHHSILPVSSGTPIYVQNHPHLPITTYSSDDNCSLGANL